MPRVSVCIPIYNGRPYVVETIRSVRAQTFTDWELVITENGSADQSHELIEELLGREPDARIKYQKFPTATGMAADWNRVMGLAQGEYIKLLPCDDRLDVECLARQVVALDAASDAGFVTCGRRIIDARGRVRMTPRRRGRRNLSFRDARHALLSGGHNPIGEPGCVLLRHNLLRVLGGFDPAFRYYSDLDFWCRALAHSPAIRLREPLCDFRVHGSTQSTALRKRYVAEYAELLERHAQSFAVSGLARAGAMLRAQLVARARSLFIGWVLGSEPAA
jgi:glycosyltransferase involved in cell wall biosynthesis